MKTAKQILAEIRKDKYRYWDRNENNVEELVKVIKLLDERIRILECNNHSHHLD